MNFTKYIYLFLGRDDGISGDKFRLGGFSTTTIIPLQNSSTLVKTNQLLASNKLASDQNQIQRVSSSTSSQDVQSINSATSNSETLVPQILPQLDGQGEVKVKGQGKGQSEADLLLHHIDTIAETAGQKFLKDLKKICG